MKRMKKRSLGSRWRDDGSLGGQTKFQCNDLEQDRNKCHSQHKSTQHKFVNISHQTFFLLATAGPSSEAARCRWVNITHVCFGWRGLRTAVGLVGDTHLTSVKPKHPFASMTRNQYVEEIESSALKNWEFKSIYLK